MLQIWVPIFSKETSIILNSALSIYETNFQDQNNPEFKKISPNSISTCQFYNKVYKTHKSHQLVCAFFDKNKKLFHSPKFVRKLIDRCRCGFFASSLFKFIYFCCCCSSFFHVICIETIWKQSSILCGNRKRWEWKEVEFSSFKENRRRWMLRKEKREIKWESFEYWWLN